MIRDSHEDPTIQALLAGADALDKAGCVHWACEGYCGPQRAASPDPEGAL